MATAVDWAWRRDMLRAPGAGGVERAAPRDGAYGVIGTFRPRIVQSLFWASL